MLAPRYVLDSLPYALSIPDPVTESYIVVALHIVRKWPKILVHEKLELDNIWIDKLQGVLAIRGFWGK